MWTRALAPTKKAQPLRVPHARQCGKRWPSSQDENIVKRKAANAAKRTALSEPVTIDVTIETPRGSRNKIKYEPTKKMYSLSKILPEGMVFPYDFGFVPRTKADDGDPLDVLVLTDEPLFPGCLVECRLIGVIELTQKEADATERNDRLIAVAQASLLYADVKNLVGLNEVVLKQVEEFFVNYQKVRQYKGDYSRPARTRPGGRAFTPEPSKKTLKRSQVRLPLKIPKSLDIPRRHVGPMAVGYPAGLGPEFPTAADQFRTPLCK
ncbi:MAG: hypothetical protein C5B51_07640 [Terriglobia bacterium]|nr:MAG: hypothetical protein C5B51_07640 [Terriglobia bacterium]